MSHIVCRTRTGCITCRIRRVKCDERKPACMRCTTTGRTCDGYPSNFRVVASAQTTIPSEVTLREPPNPSPWPLLLGRLPSPEQVRYLARHFTIKPVPEMGMSYETGMSYESEARATLCATSEPAVRHALTSLSTLRRAFEQCIGHVYKIPTGGLDVQDGLKEYNRAIRSLAMRISNHDAYAIQYSLLCCQMFISIELGLDDFNSATQHLIRGLCIMYQGRGRPYIGAGGKLLAARCTGISNVDVFAIKLFLTPCPGGLTKDFLDSDAGQPSSVMLLTERSTLVNANIQLAAIARSILSFLEGVSQLCSISEVAFLVRDRHIILEKLRAWKDDFAAIQQSRVCQLTPETRLGAAFSIFFCAVLRAVAMLALRPPGVEVTVTESVFDEMQGAARSVQQLKRAVNMTKQCLVDCTID
ncbi:hypothetical protein C7974DRAFT_162188 [Boeremia exigua]|uniref:uncharacterized protein n=1 Tax=Boeremia exigua TaxID=749465 RepID=UPI001E8D7D64|nr:uncharacterized protein C7974DRAFT_162188 [Boeremia exigua]KAH6632920.1 hypothetical protein C7974DRAFT_162188 [Boeremia exigua]